MRTSVGTHRAGPIRGIRDVSFERCGKNFVGGGEVTGSLGRSLGDRDVVTISNLLTEALKTIDILVVQLGKLIGARSAPKKIGGHWVDFIN